AATKAATGTTRAMRRAMEECWDCMIAENIREALAQSTRLLATSGTLARPRLEPSAEARPTFPHGAGAARSGSARPHRRGRRRDPRLPACTRSPDEKIASPG